MKHAPETMVTDVARPSLGTGSGATLYAARPAAGFPAPADDLVERVLDINDLVVKHPAATFFVRVEGDSMVGAGIFSGDVLVVDRAVEARAGHIVVAAVNGELVVKRLGRSQGRACLLSEHEAFAPIEIGDGETCFVWGVVVGSVRQFQ